MQSVSLILVSQQTTDYTSDLKHEIEIYMKDISDKNITTSELEKRMKENKYWYKIKNNTTFDWIKGNKIYRNLSFEEFINLHKKMGFDKNDMITMKVNCYGVYTIEHSETIK